jgi:hypothetical protein
MNEENADRLLTGYLFWGIVSICAFIVFIMLFSYAVVLETSNIILYFLLLLAGFFWIGVTSISRHIFVMLKRLIGREISIFEFLSTQFIVLLFPLFYMKLKKEIRIFREKNE